MIQKAVTDTMIEVNYQYTGGKTAIEQAAAIDGAARTDTFGDRVGAEI